MGAGGPDPAAHLQVPAGQQVVAGHVQRDLGLGAPRARRFCLALAGPAAIGAMAAAASAAGRM
jgi:hypothetical protein